MDGRVERHNRGTGRQQSATHRHARRVAQVIGPGLKRQSPHRDALAGAPAIQMLRQTTDHAIELLLVARDGALELRERLAELPSHVCQRPGVFRQAGTAPTGACRQELRPNPRVHSENAHHLVYVGAGRFADVGHRVDETQSCGQKGIRCMFREFGGWDVRHDYWRVEYSVEIRESSLNLWFGCTDEDSIGVEEVSDCASLAKKLGICRHVNVVAAEDHSQAGSGTNRHG